MAKISAERLARYRELGAKATWDIKDDAVRAIYARMTDEGCPVDEWAYNPHPGMFHAPTTRELAGVDIACVGIPMENSVPLRVGTKFGPDAVRKWSHFQGPAHYVTRVIPFEMCNVIDYGNIGFRSLDLKQRIEQIHDLYATLHRAGVVPLSVGGEHTMSYPIVKALGADEPLGLIHIDAHADTTGAIGGEGIMDANGFRYAVMDGVVDPERTIQIGIRGRTIFYWDFSYETGMRVVTAEEFQECGAHAIATEARRVVGDGPVYLSIDNDGLDPTSMPGTGLPEAFGLTAREVRDFLRGLRGLDIVGADIAEICPPADPTEVSANIGAALCFEMLCHLCEARVARTGRRRATHWPAMPGMVGS